jgi:hypothetical protein
MTFFISENVRYRNRLVAGGPDDCGSGFEINKIERRAPENNSRGMYRARIGLRIETDE